MKKLILVLTMAVLLVCMLAIGVSAAVTPTTETEVTLSDGATLKLYDEKGEGLIWFILSTDENGVNTYASVAANRNTADNATSYVTYSINSTYGTNQMHDIFIKYWNAETKAYESYGEGTIVVANFRTFKTEYWSFGAVFSSANLEYVYNSATARSVAQFTNFTKLQVVDYSLSTNFTGFATQALKNCTALRVVKIGDSQDGYVLDGTQYACLFQGCSNLSVLEIADPSDVTAIGGSAFQNCYALSMNYVFENVTSIGDNAFRDAAKNEGCSLVLSFPKIVTLGGTNNDSHVFTNSGATELYFGNTIKTIKYHTFDNCSKLWKVEFAGPVSEFNFKSYTFENCTALRAISLPEGITSLPQRMFKECTGLTAVYLPSTLTSIESGSNEAATFFKCYDMYFVSEPFTLSSANDVIERPDVYYFPSNITSIASGEVFKYCKSLNETLVFPTGVKSISNAWAFEANTSAVNLKNIVFLGDMDAVSTSSNSSAWDFTGKIYFANENDLSTDDVSVKGLDSKIVFCKAEGNKDHLYIIEIKTNPTCTEEGMNGFKCFCNTVRDDFERIPANGHEKGAIIAIEYNGAKKFFEKGDITYECDVCGEEHVVEDEAGVIFKVIGYTYTEAENPSKALMQSFAVNREALKTYNENTENDLVGYGLLSTNTSVTEAFENGVAKISAVASFYDTEYDIMELKVKGLNGRSDSIGAYADVKLHCCAYILVQNGESVDSYYATEVLDDSLTSVEITVADELSADMGASYNDIYNNRNPQ